MLGHVISGILIQALDMSIMVLQEDGRILSPATVMPAVDRNMPRLSDKLTYAQFCRKFNRFVSLIL